MTAPELTIGLPEHWTVTFRHDGTATLRNYDSGDGGTLPAQTVTALRKALRQRPASTPTETLPVEVEMDADDDNRLRGHVLELITDWAAIWDHPEISVHVSAIEVLANELAYDAPAELSAFLRAYADAIDADFADEGFEAADAARIKANLALQLAVDKARALPPVTDSTPTKAVLQ